MREKKLFFNSMKMNSSTSVKKIWQSIQKGKLRVISGPSIVSMPRQLISKKCWKPLQGKGISQKSVHLTNLTSALTVYTRILRRLKKCTLFFPSPRFYIVVIAIVSKRSNLALICYGRKDIEDDFKRNAKRFWNVKAYMAYEVYVT